MQAYEHILTFLILNAKAGKIKTREEAKEVLKNYGAFITFPDSVRGLLDVILGNAYRQPSHYTDGAKLNYNELLSLLVNKKLKNMDFSDDSNKRKIEGLFEIPDGLEMKGADGQTNIAEFMKNNPGILDTTEGSLVCWHLVQDVKSDELFNNLGEIGTIKYFREAVAKISTFLLFEKLKALIPDITFNDINMAVCESYENYYPACMHNAKKYVVPPYEQQIKISDAMISLANTWSYLTKLVYDLTLLYDYLTTEDMDLIENYVNNVTSPKLYNDQSRSSDTDAPGTLTNSDGQTARTHDKRITEHDGH